MGLASCVQLNAMTQRVRSVLIVGCGIGGPVAAMALARAGIEPTVYEARSGSAEFAGSFLNMASNGLEALSAIDARGPVLSGGFPTPRMVMWSSNGKRLGEVANGNTLADGTTSTTIKRGALHRALRDQAAERGVQIETGKRLLSAETGTDGRVRARFDDGSEASADLLIGADGVHSVVRRSIAPDAPAPRYSGMLSLGGFAHCPELGPTPGTYHMIFGRRAFFGYSVRPGGETYWFANVFAANEPDRAALSAKAQAAWRAELRVLFADDAGPALAMIDATAHDLTAYPIHDMPTVSRWHRAGMVLLGDAAHATSPSSGQGAALAIEDALVLAKCLRDIPERETALARYEQLRRARVERVVRYSARIGNTKLAGPVARALRDWLMPFALKHFATEKAQAWLYEYQVDWGQRLSA